MVLAQQAFNGSGQLEMSEADRQEAHGVAALGRRAERREEAEV